MKILVIGATGVQGRATTHKLLDKGYAVRAMTRRPDNAADLRRLGADVVYGDLQRTETLSAACAGVDAVLFAAHSLLGRGSEASKYVDDIGAKQLIDLAQEAGVRHFVYTSVQGAAPDNPVPFTRIKHNVECYLQRSGLS